MTDCRHTEGTLAQKPDGTFATWADVFAVDQSKEYANQPFIFDSFDDAAEYIAEQAGIGAVSQGWRCADAEALIFNLLERIAQLENGGK